ncbi:MAG: ATPase, T2SS/T4P/T4SS family, partial [Actinomycetota bacterium]
MNLEQPTKVLVIDDDADTRLLTMRYLEKASVKAFAAANGMEGLAACRREQPDLVLLDVMMPDLDGYQVCAQLQRDPSTAYIPVIFLTGLGKEQDKARALSAGAADYLVKPVSREQLLETLQRHADTRRRWYSVRLATDLWDEAPLPQKFAKFRDLLVTQFNPAPDALRQIQALKAADVYLIAGLVDLTDGEIAERMAAFFGLEYLTRIDTQSIQLGVLPTSFCRSNYAVAVKDANGEDAVVVSNPFSWDLDQLDALNRAFRNRPYRLQITTERSLAELFLEDPNQRKSHTPSTPVELAEEETLTVERLMVAGAEPTVVEIVNVLIADAARKGASDLHIEPMRNTLRVRYRVDGGMRSVMPLQRSLLPNIAARFKVMCGMDLSENRRPQDGSCTVRVGGEEMELRVSTLPGINGEIIVARLLSRQSGSLALTDLGMEENTLRGFRGLLSSRQGMILVTGPTGSGKTTTLYSALHHLNAEDVNIITVEDPVEVSVEGINQVQVHERAGRSFAETLRAMLRQDPDVIMLGEIRDAETAEIACRAALTGHLVLTTMHTQHTIGTLARLFDIGIAPYLVASSLHGIMAQRLARRVCDFCSQVYEPPIALRRAIQAHFGASAPTVFRKGAGCNRCGRSGVRGRIAIHELLLIDDDLRRLVSEGAPPS